jgi:hypothetical protein
MRDEGLTHDNRRRAVVELDDEQKLNLMMRHQDGSSLAWDMLLLPLSITGRTTTSI